MSQVGGLKWNIRVLILHISVRLETPILPRRFLHHVLQMSQKVRKLMNMPVKQVCNTGKVKIPPPALVLIFVLTTIGYP